MAFRISEMTVLRMTDPVEFGRRFRSMITKHKGKLTHVAQDLGVGITTVKRWVSADDKFKTHTDKVRERRRLAA